MKSLVDSTIIFYLCLPFIRFLSLQNVMLQFLAPWKWLFYKDSFTITFYLYASMRPAYKGKQPCSCPNVADFCIPCVWICVEITADYIPLAILKHLLLMHICHWYCIWGTHIVMWFVQLKTVLWKHNRKDSLAFPILLILILMPPFNCALSFYPSKCLALGFSTHPSDAIVVPTNEVGIGEELGFSTKVFAFLVIYMLQ